MFRTVLSIALLLPAALSTADAPKLNCEAAAEYLAANHGHAMLVYQGDELVFERYFNGHAADKPHRLASGTKSFSGAMAAAAVDDGLLTFDEPVSKTITEWQDDPRLSKITIRQLLSLTSGMDAGQSGKVPSYTEAIQSKALHAPGTRFQYGPAPFQVFGELMRRKLDGKSPLSYLEERIFKPIGMEYTFWRKDPDGNPNLPSGVLLTAKEWAKFGLLMRDGGRELIQQETLSECFKGAKKMPGYGMTFWLGTGGRLPKGLVMAAGKGKQKLYIFPEKDLLVLQFAESNKFQEAKFLNLLLGGNAAAEGPSASDPTFLLRDTNRDGVITADEVKSKLIFKAADKDRDGKVTPVEFQAWLEKRGR